jgi:hypothetical protein
MNRRSFFKKMIGGVAAAAAVRTWPFRIYSFPSQVKPIAIDFGYSAFSFGGLPMYVDKFCPPGKIYTINANLQAGKQYKVLHPNTLDELLKNIKVTTITGLHVP